MAVYGPVCHPQNSIWTEGSYNILWVTSRSIDCHMALSSMNYLLTSTWVVSTIIKGIVDAGVCKMKVWSFKS
jgi:hypothetical protein